MISAQDNFTIARRMVPSVKMPIGLRPSTIYSR